jgi:Endonuclease NucS
MSTISFRGQQITDQDVRDAMERFDRDRRETFARWRTYAITHHGQQYPPKEILRMIVGDIGNLNGGEQTNHYFRDLGFDVGEVDDDVAAPGAAIEDALETKLHLESDLERFLLGNLGQLENGLALFVQSDLRGQQFDAGPAGRIDLLAVDACGNLVVIELKAGEADRQVCGQIQAYMGWVMDNLAAGRKVRGILVADSFTPRCKLAAKVVPGLTLRQYSVIFNFKEP